MTDLDQLDGMATEADIGAKALDPVDPNAPLPPAVVDYPIEARKMVDMLGGLIAGYSPQCGPLWNAPTRERIAEALAPVLVKYNVTMGAIPPEITLLFIAGPVLYQSSKIIAHQMNAEKKAAQDVQDAVIKPAHIAPTDTPEAPVSPQTALYPS